MSKDINSLTDCISKAVIHNPISLDDLAKIIDLSAKLSCYGVRAEEVLSIMKKTVTLESCDDCKYYKYVRCYGDDCFHPDAPNEAERGDEPLAENREGDFPLWCPL